MKHRFEFPNYFVGRSFFLIALMLGLALLWSTATPAGANGPTLSRTDLMGVSTAATGVEDNPMIFRMDKDGNMIWDKPLPFQKFGTMHQKIADRNITEDAFYVNVSSYNYNLTDGKGRVQKYNDVGDLMWDLPLTAPGAYGGIGPVSANPVMGGIYVIDGTKGAFRIDTNGSVIWGPNNYGYTGYFYDISTDVTDGGAFVTNYTAGVVLKVDSNGNIIWTKNIPEATKVDSCAVDGGLYVGAGGYSRNTYKLDAAGNIQWMKSCFPSCYTYPRAVSPVDGGLYVASGWPSRFVKVALDGSVLWNVPSNPIPGYDLVNHSITADIDENHVYSTSGYYNLGVNKFNGADASQIWHVNPGYYTYQGGYGPSYWVYAGTPATKSPPVLGQPNDVTVNEGVTTTNTGTVSDPDGDNVTLSASAGTITNNGDGTWSWSMDAVDGPADSQTVNISADDGNGGTAQTSFALTVNNMAPSLGQIGAPISPVLLGTTMSVNTTFHDDGILDTHTAVYDWGDGSTTAASVSETGGSGTASGSHAYTSAGVYTLKLTVTDKDGGSADSTYEYVVVYDPSAGFVTGGGWINSPAGAYAADPSLTGKASFGFVSRYQKGASVPTGQTQFQFSVAGLSFHSSSYDWLVISGPKAQYKGTGTINGTVGYGFMLTATDGQLMGGGGMDKFRIKIWDKATGAVVYDNMMGSTYTDSPTTILGGGSIVIHK